MRRLFVDAMRMPMSAMREDMQERACKNENEGQNAKHVAAVLGEQE